MNVTRRLAAFAALNGALAVLIGAFAAHGAGPQVKTLLTTGGHYLMVHAVLALVCAIWPGQDRLIVLAGWLAVWCSAFPCRPLPCWVFRPWARWRRSGAC